VCAFCQIVVYLESASALALAQPKVVAQLLVYVQELQIFNVVLTALVSSVGRRVFASLHHLAKDQHMLDSALGVTTSNAVHCRIWV